MDELAQKIVALQDKMYKAHETSEDEPYDFYESSRLGFAKIGDLYEISFYGNGFVGDPLEKGDAFDYDECECCAFRAVLELIVDHHDQICSLVFRGPDQGANGMRDWSFESLYTAGVHFSQLMNFEVALTDAGDHNISVIVGGEMYEESGAIAKLVSVMPKLERLVVPSVPDHSFFELERLPLQELIVQVGADPQDFIANLAKSKNLPVLRFLDFGEKLEAYHKLQDSEFISYADYKKLFQSGKNFSFTLREARLTQEQLIGLQDLNERITLLHISLAGSDYVSHLKQRLTEE